ncbi:helix-turn-helix domain-containing protein [Salinicoccus carnicancri]|uniref:helix-turn-helix domain-containing protein n=1 Tax=Salinicoccus carnicancri TaxID=558170 RepID=UPI0003156A83|nr:XRE family transcriptional regulator [Salinicoccus carnicancri]
MDDSLGSELKKVRKGKKMTLQELSDRSGLSISFLSQVERGLRTLTFTSLRKISESLEVNINFFFDNGGTSIKKQVNKTTSDSGNFSYTSLVGRMKKPDFTPAIIELNAGESQKVPYTHSGQEFVYVLSGQLEVELEGVKETLYENESIHIDSSLAHHWYNDTDEVTVLLLVSSNQN